MGTRMFYVALGAATGVLVVRQVARAVSSLSPTSLAGSFVQSVREFAADVGEAMAEREEEIRSALGLDDADGSGDGERTGAATSTGAAASDQDTAAPGPDEFDPERTMRLVPGARRP
ncbi:MULTISPECIES: hypothetical protein [Frankiaceae]|uniref:Uncharacterized protein n=1 Tax=Parafrankia soli TaxID=2599596 RepID=A0A1S1Q1F5_9ACTN|nr:MULTISPECIES: hypothetical protein [Frankiaceae]OHV27399.1 hypothetical protein BBK14_20985 [Parafrankia soli]TCJ34812.1 hypothetical protein E0504_30885 [Parafrankia sp. BMG5.11]CAI7977647.1 conserved exported hypothetical protein [Frankia sp. Hr75.2]SQD97872.1 conserved exported hypothetical protein [Parafrankia sp. Ea1.12]